GEVITGVEWQDRNRKGETGWRMGYAFPLYGKDGSIEFGVIMNVDITDRKLADTELRKSEEKYRQLFEFSPAQNLIIGADGIIKDVNKAVINGSGYKREELVGRNILDLVTIEQKENMGPKLEKYFKEGFEEETEVVAFASDGSEHTILFAAGEPVYIYEGDQITGTLLTGIDITERKQALEKIKQHEDQLLQAAKMVSLGTLVSGVAHEINNPNHFILLNSKIFSRVWDDIVPVLSDHAKIHEDFYLAGMPFADAREKLPALLSGISEGALRIEKIVRSLKDFSRQDKGELDQRIAVNSVVEDAIVIISNLIKKSTNRFSVVYGSDLPAVQGNSQQLEQVVINLISNSCQALQSREKRLLVSTDYDGDTDCIIIKVEDEGEGIPPENMKSIMDPFFTTKRDREGTGLGLSISYNIVANHNGELKISSEPGRGTTAFVRLPVYGN
ncbi:MAG: PAS domain S-box protein, partial [Spirochaetes bacterium]|nr:PAS domain S-box protein [Spirochaetota bacterium]